MKDFIKSHCDRIRASVAKLGGETSELQLGAPASRTSVEATEKAIGVPLPADFSNFLMSGASSVEFSWQLPEEYSLPAAIGEVHWGGLSVDLDRILEHEKHRKSWVKECFPNRDDPYDAVWHDKIAFHDVPNGDYLAFDRDGRVVYLSHDDGEGHGATMAPSFASLLRAWIPLGCPGPEDWLWLAFVGDEARGIDERCANSRLWLETLGTALP